MGGSFGLQELLIVLVVAFIVFVIFGPKNLPKLGKMFGSTMKEVRKGMSEFSEELNSPEMHDPAEFPVETPVAEPERKVAQVIYEDELEKPEPAVAIDPDRKVAKIVYEDEAEG